MRFGVRWAVAWLALAAPAASAAEPVPIENGDFAKWTGKVPAAWKVEVGGREGEGVPSSVSKAEDGGVVLEGDSSTRIWRMLTQTVPVVPNASYRLSFEARAKGLVREGTQRDNAYVGIADVRADAIAIKSLVYVTPTRESWTPEEVVFRPDGDRAAIAVFLSKSGLLGARAFRLERLAPADSYDVLVRQMDRYYPSFPARKVDWKALSDSHRAAAVAAKDEAAFEKAVSALLAPLQDPHVTVRDSRGGVSVPYSGIPEINADFREVTKRVTNAKRYGSDALAGDVGETTDGIGYMAVFSLPTDPGPVGRLVAAFDGLLDRRALILDLRANSGGDERTARTMVSALTDESRVYAKRRVRSGPGHGDLGPEIEAVLDPRAGKRFAGQVIVLLGPGCVSSGEGMAMMLASIPRVKTVGLPTRGESGSPRTIDLPNGVSVGFSTWMTYHPDGTALVGKGVVPQVRVEATTGKGDPAFAAAVAEARKALGLPE